MKTENEMNNNGQRTPAAGNGTRKPNFRHKNYRYKAQPKKDGKDGQKQGQDKQAKGNYKPQFRGQGKPALKRPRKNNNGSKLKIIPLGGLEQIGMNITAFEYEDSIVVVDCGLAFPEDDMPGIDLVIPDITYLKENISKVKGFVITHGHEDHIGALPYVLKEVNAPIYSTKLTLALISNKLKEHNLTKTTKLKEVKHGQVINLGDFAIEFIKTNHSIQDASALAIYSPVGIVYTQVTSRWTIPLYLEMPLICRDLRKSDGKAFLPLCVILQMRNVRALPCLSVQLVMFLTIFLMNIRLQESLSQRLLPM